MQEKAKKTNQNMEYKFGINKSNYILFKYLLIPGHHPTFSCVSIDNISRLRYLCIFVCYFTCSTFLYTYSTTHQPLDSFVKALQQNITFNNTVVFALLLFMLQ